MRGDRTFTSQSCFFFTRRFKKCWQLFDSLLTHNWKDNGVRKDLCGVWGLFPIVQTSIDGRGYSSMNKAAWKLFRRRRMMSLSSFHSFVRFPFRVTNKNERQRVHHKKNSPRKRDGWPRRVFFKAAMLDWYYTERYGSTNLRRSTGT